jgi:hypothetical protein
MDGKSRLYNERLNRARSSNRALKLPECIGSPAPRSDIHKERPVRERRNSTAGAAVVPPRPKENTPPPPPKDEAPAFKNNPFLLADKAKKKPPTAPAPPATKDAPAEPRPIDPLNEKQRAELQSKREAVRELKGNAMKRGRNVVEEPVSSPDSSPDPSPKPSPESSPERLYSSFTGGAALDVPAAEEEDSPAGVAASTAVDLVWGAGSGMLAAGAVVDASAVRAQQEDAAPPVQAGDLAFLGKSSGADDELKKAAAANIAEIERQLRNARDSESVAEPLANVLRRQKRAHKRRCTRR